MIKRRKVIQAMFAASALTAISIPSNLVAAAKAPKESSEMSFGDAVDAITSDKGALESKLIKLTVPEIAENSAVVPVKVMVDHPMNEKSYVKAIHILNTKNANSRSADVMLTPANGKGYFATRVKLSKTQDIVAIVELSDGKFIKTSKSVKVTIGGCG